MRLMRSDKNSILVSVRDEGVGLPVGFDPTTSKRLSAQFVNALSTQLGSRDATEVGHRHQFLLGYSIAGYGG